MTKLHKELSVQIAACDYIRYQYPFASSSIVKITNEGGWSHYTREKFIKAGMRPKASDLFVAFPHDPYSGLWIEVKPWDFKLTKSNREHWDGQIAFIHQMIKQGFAGAMCIGIDDCIEAIDYYFKKRMILKRCIYEFPMN